MEDRYEIRGKIGQGGIGTVYRGYDMRMNREVAIKRILQSPEDPSLREEATKQLVVEAGALASLQHPNIVTVYDVGSDEDGPYVVMELISGKTLDEIIESAPLTWHDFRELAMQSQEALIAAQELDMIHSDLKPPNIMLTWLPSGKFQVKIVDFGLAVLVQNQSKEEIEALEAVFGSIFFMPPEQFERETLCMRSDLYSMGCVYYQALTGVYPFNGETGSEVMDAHLNHTVTPIHELRSDIPMWACDWVMWHINRYREDRPESAREALSSFLQNDKEPNPVMSSGGVDAKRPRLIIPGQVPSSPSSLTSDSKKIFGVPLSAPDTATHPFAEETGRSKSAPQVLTPPDGKPSVHTGTAPVHEVQQRMKSQAVLTKSTGRLTSQVATATSRQVYISPVTSTAQEGKPRIPNSLKVVVAVVLCLLVVMVSWMLVNRSKQNALTKNYNKIIALASASEVTKVPVVAEEIDMLLDVVTSTGAVNEREEIYKALRLAHPTDSTNVDMVVMERISTTPMHKDIRKQLFSEVLEPRANPDMVPRLMAYAAAESTDVDSAIAAYRAVQRLVTEDQTDDFLEVLCSNPQAALRRVAEDNLDEIIRISTNRATISRRLIGRYDNARDPKIRHALIRLLGRTNVDSSLKLIEETLNTGRLEDQIAAIVALGNWEGPRAFDVLHDFVAGTNDAQLRNKSFESMTRLLSQPFSSKDLSDAELKSRWSKLCDLSVAGSEKTTVIRALVQLDVNWTIELLQRFTNDQNSSVSSLAEKGITAVREREALRGR